MKRMVLMVVVMVLTFTLYAEPIYHVNLPNGVAFINRKGELVIGPIEFFSGGYPWGLNTEFNGIGIAVLSDKRDHKYHLLTSEGQWLYASEKALIPASYTRVWEQVSETVWQLIDFSGKEYYRVKLKEEFILGIHTTNLGYFVEGKAVVVTEKGSRVIDEYGNEISKPPYDQDGKIWNYPWNYSGKYLDSGIFVGLADKGKEWLRFVIQNIQGEVVYGPEEVWPIGVPSEGKVFVGTGYVDAQGKRGKDGSGYFYGHHYTEGLAAVLMPGRKDPKHFYAYFINHNGEIVIDGEALGITDARPFSDGLAVVSTRPPVPSDNIRKAMDIFTDNPFTSMLYKEGLWGAIDKQGNWVIQPKFPDPFRFDRGLALLKFEYSYITDSMIKMKIKPQNAERYVYIDKEGKVVYDSMETIIKIGTSINKTWRIVDPGFQFE